MKYIENDEDSLIVFIIFSNWQVYKWKYHFTLMADFVPYHVIDKRRQCGILCIPNAYENA